MVKKSWGFFSSISIFILFSACAHWEDKDLYIPEVFINSKHESYLILKNQGHSRINEKGILLKVTWDYNQSKEYLLDTLDPHFRKPGDSSIVKLPFTTDGKCHFIFARIDESNIVSESDEDHNIYSKLLCEDNAMSSSYTYPLTSKYDEKEYKNLMEAVPFANQVIWYESDKPYILSFWPPLWKQQLLKKIQSGYTGFQTYQTDSLPGILSHDEAFDIFLNYIAHSFILEKEKLVPWSVHDFPPNIIGDLWNSKNYFRYDSIHLIYELDYESSGGVHVEHPISSYSFGGLLNNQFTSPHDAIYNLLEWARAFLFHVDVGSQINFQSIPKIWFPEKGQIHQVSSCWATSGLILDYCRALNIPVIKSSIELHNGIHAQLFFPTEYCHLTHADDLYDPLFFPVNHHFPISDILLNPSAYTKMVNANRICQNDSCQTKGAQQTYDRRRYLLNQAIKNQGAEILIKNSEPISSIRALLRGDEFPGLLVPVFNVMEQDQIIQRLNQIPIDRQRLTYLFSRYQSCKNNFR